MYLSQKAFNITVLPNIIFGVNSVERNLSSKIKEYGKSNVFLATDRGLVESGIVEKIVHLLEKSNIRVVVFSDVEREPSANTVMKGADVYKKENCDILVRSEEHTSELQSRGHLVCRLLLEKKK